MKCRDCIYHQLSWTKKRFYYCLKYAKRIQDINKEIICEAFKEVKE
jgi:hypothetical protein